MPITITNNTSSNLIDYQVKVIVNTATPIAASKMMNTGDDIRFLDSGSCQPMAYWIESGINTVSTVIWVKMPNLPANAHRTIRMLYGNSSAGAASNGDSTFILFDDFNASTLNSTKWSAPGQSGTLNLSGGYLELSTPTSGRYLAQIIVSKGSFQGPLIVEDNLISISGYWHSLGIFNSGTTDGYGCFAGTTSTTNSMNLGTITSNYPAFGAQKTIVNSTPGNLTGIWQLAWPSSNVQSVTWPGGTMNATLSGISLANTVQIGAGMITESNGSISIDWIRARNYASADATALPGVEGNNHNSGINKLSQTSDIYIYPNPAHDKLYIDLSKSVTDLKSIQILDLNGKSVRMINTEGQKENIELPINDFTKGVYIIRLISGNESVERKLIVD